MDIDTTLKEPAPKTSPSKQTPVLQNCFVLLSPCPAFPAPSHIPTQSNTPTDNTTQDATPILVHTNDDSSVIPPNGSPLVAPNPVVESLANDPTQTPSPKKRKLTPEERQYAITTLYYHLVSYLT